LGSRLPTRKESDVASSLQLGPLGQVSLISRDTARVERFYRDTLGLRHVFTFGDLAFFDAGGVRIYVQAKPEKEWRPSSVLYFLVPDIAAAYAELQSRGVHFLGAPHMIYRDDATGSEEWMAFFEDSEGNMLAVMSRVAAPAAEAAVTDDRPAGEAR
jgi:catechol 2,3-dioxygenase-like lactoylglutathione lyase family enzyme